MLRNMFLTCLFLICGLAKAQYNIPPYTVVKDSATHTSVIHSSDADIAKIRTTYWEKGVFIAISPEIKIKNGIVDHRGITGTMFVREYYSDNKLIGYIQYDGPNREREIYYNTQGDIYLEKRYDKGAETYRNDSIRKPSVLAVPVIINHDNSSK